MRIEILVDMKYIFTLFIIIFWEINPVYSQFVVGKEKFFITGETTVFIDSMVVIPMYDHSIEGNELVVSRVPVPGVPNGSIARVYQWKNKPFDFQKGTIGLYFNPVPEELNGNDPGLLQLAFDATLTNNFTVSSGSTSINNFVSEEFGSGFSWHQMTAARISSVLPLVLLSFDAAVSGADVLVRWLVAQENGVENYIVTRSNNGTDFQPIGSLKAKCNGCRSEMNYSYTDKDALAGINYYRLNMVEADGSIRYSDVKTVRFEKGISIVVNPNPAITETNIAGLSLNRKYQLSVYSADGKLVFKNDGISGVTRLKVNMSDWTGGMYFIHLTDNENNSYRFKVIKR